jgi:hypothetical protein
MKITKELILRIELTEQDSKDLNSALTKIIGISEVPINQDYLNVAEQKALKAIYNEIK